MYLIQMRIHNHIIASTNATKFKRTRIFVTPRVVESSMKLKRVRIYISHSIQLCRRSQSSEMIQNATQCHEMPCNHQFERRYINPRVTYVEKPNRLQLNLSVNWLIYWVPVIYLNNQIGTGSTYVENYQRLRNMLKWKNRVSKPRYISPRALT